VVLDLLSQDMRIIGARIVVAGDNGAGEPLAGGGAAPVGGARGGRAQKCRLNFLSAPLIPRKIPCRSCIAMVPCALLIENRGGGYQLRPLEESTSCDSRDSVIPSTSPSLYTLHLYGTFHGMQRTMRLKLHPMPEQAHTLTATLAQFTDAFNWVGAYGWEHNEKNGVRLHHAWDADSDSTGTAITSCRNVLCSLYLQGAQ